MEVTLSERDIESLSNLLAALLVAEWKAQHVAHGQGSNPLGDLTMASESNAESMAYGPESQKHDPGPTSKPKGHGSLTLVPGSPKRRPNRR
jgi:hypothetical protein